MHLESGLSNQFAGKPIITFQPYVTSRTNASTFFYQKQPLRVPEERNVRPCEELALPQPTKFGFRSQEDEQTSCTTSRLTLVLSMRERARLGLSLRANCCVTQHSADTTLFRPDPLRAFTGSGCGYARLICLYVFSPSTSRRIQRVAIP